MNYKRSGSINVYAETRRREAAQKEKIDNLNASRKATEEAFLESLSRASISQAQERRRFVAVGAMSTQIYEMALETTLFKTFMDALIIDKEEKVERMESLRETFSVALESIGGIKHVEQCAKEVPFLNICVEAAKCARAEFSKGQQRTKTTKNCIDDHAYDFQASFRDSRQEIAKGIGSLDNEQVSALIQKKVVDTVSYEKGEAIAVGERLKEIDASVDGTPTTESFKGNRGRFSARTNMYPKTTLFTALSESHYKRKLDEGVIEYMQENYHVKDEDQNANNEDIAIADFMQDRIDSMDEFIGGMSADEDGVMCSIDDDIAVNENVQVDTDEVLFGAVVDYTVMETFNTLNLTRYKSTDVINLIRSIK